MKSCQKYSSSFLVSGMGRQYGMLHQPKIHFKAGDGSSTQRNFSGLFHRICDPENASVKTTSPTPRPWYPSVWVPCSNGRFGSHWRRSLKRRSSGLSSCTLVALGSICTCKTFFIRSQLSFFVHMPRFPQKTAAVCFP